MFFKALACALVVGGIGISANHSTESITNPTEFFVSEGSTGTISIALGPDVSVLVEIGLINVVFKLSGQTTTIQSKRQFGPGIAGTFIKVGDYNFDNQLDLAISSSSGYGGVNLFYELFLINRDARTLIPTGLEICNPALHEASKSLLSYRCKSGPKIETRWYRFNDGQFNQWATSRDITNDLQRFEYATGKIVISNWLTPGLPATWQITADYIKTYSAANLNAALEFRLKRGQFVEILEVLDREWLMVQSPHIARGKFWIKLSDGIP